MNGLEILGLACVDRTFRRQLFENVDAVINANRTDLTWAEEEGLRRITKSHFTMRKDDARAHALKADDAPAAPAMLKAAGASGDTPSTLEQDMAKVGEDIDMMCPTVPCAWPDSFTQNEPKTKPIS